MQQCNTRIKVLFVDDDPRLLQGLRRMLHGMRSSWDMRFVENGPLALEALEREDFDVIVCDMRMPEMTGAEVLGIVRKRHPLVARIVLSGQSEQESILQALGAVHQFMSKPCSQQNLIETISRACSLRDILHNESLRRLVNGLKFIPSPPDRYKRLIEKMESDQDCVDDIAAVVGSDPAMSAKILQLVNSDFFSAAQRVIDPKEAVRIIGADTMRSLVLSVDVFSECKQIEKKGLSIDNLWAHCITVGAFARQICIVENAGIDTAELAFTAGSLHDIGKLVLALNCQDKWQELQKMVSHGGLDYSTAEKEVFGVSHAEIGAYLLGLWGIPVAIVETVAFHHNPGLYSGSEISPVCAVYLADVFDAKGRAGIGEMHEELLDQEYLRRIGVEDRISDLRLLCQVTAEEKLNEYFNSF